MKGLFPAIDQRLLPENYATEAENVDLREGVINRAKGLLPVGTTLSSSTKTLYLYNPEVSGGFWFQFDEDVDIVKGQIVGGVYDRVYYTMENGKPRYTYNAIATAGNGPYPTGSRELGVPRPDSVVASGPNLANIPDGGQEAEVSYVRTFVTDLGEEGPPSILSNVVKRYDGGTVNLTGLTGASGAFVLQSQRIYRSELSGVYQFVAEIPISANSFADSIDSKLLGTQVETEGWLAPAEGLRGLTAMPNGVMAGFYGNTLAFSEPFQPHAWPAAYEIPIDFTPVACAHSAGGLIVATTGVPYVIDGSHPSAFGAERLELVQACSSKRSMVDMGYYVVYASNEGLVGVGPGLAKVVTEDMITPDQWRSKYDPASIVAFKYDDEYLGFYGPSNNRKAFTFSQERGLRDWSIGSEVGYTNPYTGGLFVKSGNQLYQFGEGSKLNARWKSKLYQTNQDLHFTYAKVDSNSYPVTLTIDRDGSTWSRSVNSSAPFRVPNKNRFRDFSYEIQCTSGEGVALVQFGRTISELS